jgi:hypothetical protein
MSKFTYVEDLNTCYTYGAYKYTAVTKNLPYPAETNNFSGYGNILVLSSEYQEISTKNMWAVQLLYDNWGHIYKRIFNWHSWTNFIRIYPDYSQISLAINGYIIFINGLIMQWGTASFLEDGYVNIYSISFTTLATRPVGCLSGNSIQACTLRQDDTIVLEKNGFIGLTSGTVKGGSYIVFGY